MPDRQPVVCFGCYDYWNSNPGSPVQIMNTIGKRGHPVLWINSIGMNLPRLRRRGLARRVLLRLRSWSRWLRSARPGFHVLSPVVLPLFGNRWIEKLNDQWLLWQIRLAYRILGFRRPLNLVCMPSFAGAVARLPRSEMIYYYTDKYDSYRDITAKAAIASRDEALFNSADLVLCASEKIYQGLKDKRSGVHYLPHAVDFDHFQAVLQQDTEMPDDLAHIPSPRIGYFGSLTDSNDIEMIHHCATRDPALQFVLIGRVLSDYSLIENLPNVHLLGFKPYAEIPLYGKYFDVAFMNWKMTEWIRHCSPVKTKEYLSLGLPVVSVPIEELATQFADVVLLADSGPTFLAAIHAALANDSPVLHQQRIDLVRNDSWTTRVEQIFDLVDKVGNDTGTEVPHDA